MFFRSRAPTWLSGGRLSLSQEAEAAEGGFHAALDEARGCQRRGQRAYCEATVESAEGSPQADRDQMTRIAAHAQGARYGGRFVVGLHQHESTTRPQDTPHFRQHAGAVRN